MVSNYSFEELHLFAEELGVPRKGFQGDHYDIPDEYRTRAIAMGATAVPSRELLQRLKAAGLRFTPSQRRAWGSTLRPDLPAAVEDVVMRMLQKNPDGTSNYDSQANQNFAKNLKGKLLLAHGSMDNNVPFYSTLLVVNELIKYNKDFDLIIFPNRGHGFGNVGGRGLCGRLGLNRGRRRREDYFVQ